MDKLLIGCGYLGSRVAARWLAEGHRVFATTRSPARAEELRRQGIEPIVGDVLDPASLKQLPVVQTVCHAVGLDRAAGRSMREVYVEGLRNVLAALPSPERFLYISSTGVYGQCDGEEVDETAATEPLEDSGQVVLAAEQQLRERLPNSIILRFAGIYGPGRLLRRQAIAAGEPIVGDADKWLNLIHVEDGAAAVLAAEQRGQPGQVYNVCDDAPVRRRDFYTALARLLHAPEPRFVAPAPGAPLPGHERANRRLVNRRLRQELNVTLRYPSYGEGLPASVQSAVTPQSQE
ncbi:MAG: SDR family oxidoreductase [Planctomycetia bacterium]|nr:SDR family oxidoreductase [Planctomycetia bacterium]